MANGQAIPLRCHLDSSSFIHHSHHSHHISLFLTTFAAASAMVHRFNPPPPSTAPRQPITVRVEPPWPPLPPLVERLRPPPVDDFDLHLQRLQHAAGALS